MDEMRQALDQGLPELGLDLPEKTRDTLCRFGKAVVEQNRVMNLTAITEPGPVARLHLLDSLTVLLCEDLAGKTVIDVGCGAGFPGVPAAIGCPEMKLTLLDSLGKRMHWLETVLPELGVQAECVTARAEEEAFRRRLRREPGGGQAQYPAGAHRPLCKGGRGGPCHERRPCGRGAERSPKRSKEAGASI